MWPTVELSHEPRGQGPLFSEWPWSSWEGQVNTARVRLRPRRKMRPNPSLKPSPNSKTPGPVCGALHSPQPEPGVFLSVPAQLER
jgi:hypothetical protein